MKSLLRLAAPALLAAPVFAQFGAPHESIQKFEPYIGHWEGGGTFAMPMSDERAPWTCTLDLEFVLGGTAVREILDVDMGEGMPHFHMMAIYTYNAATEQMVHFKADNYKGVSTGLAQWKGTSLVTAGMDAYPEMDGSLSVAVERNLWTFTSEKDSTLAITMLSGDTDPSTHVDGTITKTDSKPRPMSPTLRTRELSEGLQPMASMLGKWHFKGSMDFMGMEMAIGGAEDIYGWIGGNAMIQTTFGDEIAGMGDFQYEAMAFTAWNAGAKRFDNYLLDNMGSIIHSQQQIIAPGVLCVTHSGVQEGKPYAERGILKFSDAGPGEMYADRMTGDGEVVRYFQGKYTKSE